MNLRFVRFAMIFRKCTENTRSMHIMMHWKCTVVAQRMVLFSFTLLLYLCMVSSAANKYNKVASDPKAKPSPLECRKVKSEYDYAGHVNKTKFGETCQAWNSTHPNSHTFKVENFPDKNMDAAGSYCRNPNKDPHGPWCFLQKSTGSSYCNIPYCDDKKYRRECREDRQGLEYRGTMSKTLSGFTCQRWDAQKPHKHIYKDISKFPENTLKDAENYCRNPDGEPDGPWCFTTNYTRGWELCPIPFCHTDECKHYYNGSTYAGNAQHTHTGKKCQRWDSQFPHPHNYDSNTLFPDATVTLAENYCRNPDPRARKFGPWCYIMDLDSNVTAFEYCWIPMCNKNYDHWTSIFETHKVWRGAYLYNKKWRAFKFTVKGLKFPWEDQRGGRLLCQFDDGSSLFDLEGWVTQESTFMLRQIRKHHVEDWFMHGFSVNGHIFYDKTNSTWKYVGIERSGYNAVQRFEMSPVDPQNIGIGHRPGTKGTKDDHPANVTGLAVGITLGLIVMLVIIVVGVFCIKKKGVTNYKQYFKFHNPGVVEEERI